MRASHYSVSLRKTPARISNREVIDELRLIQQEMRGLESRMSRIENKQQKLGLRFISCAMAVTDDQLVIRPEVRRGR